MAGFLRNFWWHFARLFCASCDYLRFVRLFALRAIICAACDYFALRAVWPCLSRWWCGSWPCHSRCWCVISWTTWRARSQPSPFADGVAAGRVLVAGGVAAGRVLVAGGVAAGRRPGRPRRGRNEQPHGAYPAGVRGVGYPCPFPFPEPRRGSTIFTLPLSQGEGY